MPIDRKSAAKARGAAGFLFVAASVVAQNGWVPRDIDSRTVAYLQGADARVEAARNAVDAAREELRLADEARNDLVKAVGVQIGAYVGPCETQFDKDHNAIIGKIRHYRRVELKQDHALVSDGDEPCYEHITP